MSQDFWKIAHWLVGPAAISIFHGVWWAIRGAFKLDYSFYSIKSQTDFSKSTLQFYFSPIPTSNSAIYCRNLSILTPTSSSRLSTLNLLILTILIQWRNVGFCHPPAGQSCHPLGGSHKLHKIGV